MGRRWCTSTPLRTGPSDSRPSDPLPAASRAATVVTGRAQMWRSEGVPVKTGSLHPESRLGVELDDQSLFERDRQGYLIALGCARERAGNLVLVPVQVGRRLGRHL